MIDRRRIKALGVEIMQSEAPIVIEGQAFTTGAVPRTSIERVLPKKPFKLVELAAAVERAFGERRNAEPAWRGMPAGGATR